MRRVVIPLNDIDLGMIADSIHNNEITELIYPDENGEMMVVEIVSEDEYEQRGK